MSDSILDLKTPWIPVGRELGGQKWRLRFTYEALLLVIEHFGGEQEAGEALTSLMKPGPKKASVLVVYLWAALQEDAYAKWRRGERKDDTVPLEEVMGWLPEDRGELQQLLNDVFGAYTAAQPKQDPNA